MAVQAKAKKKSKQEDRFSYAQKILEGNSDEVRRTVNHMVDTMQRMNPNADEKMLTYIAVRLLVSAAEWDIRISGFKLPAKSCARCGKKIKRGDT